MRYAFGGLLFAFGAWLLWSAHQRRQRVPARRILTPAEITASASGHPSLAVLGDVMPSIMVGFLVYGGLKATLLFFAVGAGRWLSLFDLAGLLFLLASYGIWLVIMTRHRVAPAAGANGRRDHEQELVVPGGDADHAGTGARVRDLAAEVPASTEKRAGRRRAA